MAYTYSAYIAVTNTDRRYANFTATPTVTVLDGLAAAVIASPAPTLTNLDAVGHYRAAITIATLTDVIFAIAPAAADQAAIADISTLHTKVEQVIDENIDATTTSRLASDDPRLDNLDAPISGTSTLTQADILSDGNPFPGAFIDAAISSAVCSGPGAAPYVITINDPGGNPLDGVNVWISTDLAGVNVIANGFTDSFGNVTFMLDAGTYYAWKQLAGYSFTNPQEFSAP